MYILVDCFDIDTSTICHHIPCHSVLFITLKMSKNDYDEGENDCGGVKSILINP